VIRLLAIGAWTCAATLLSGIVALSWQSGELPKVEAVSLFGGLTAVRLPLISVPIIRDGRVQGYAVAKLAFAVDSGLLKQLSIKPELILLDEAIRAIYADEALDFRKLERQKLSQLSHTLAENINSRVSANLVHEVLIEELNYLSKEEVRRRSRS